MNSPTEEISFYFSEIKFIHLERVRFYLLFNFVIVNTNGEFLYKMEYRRTKYVL